MAVQTSKAVTVTHGGSSVGQLVGYSISGPSVEVTDTTYYNQPTDWMTYMVDTFIEPGEATFSIQLLNSSSFPTIGDDGALVITFPTVGATITVEDAIVTGYTPNIPGGSELVTLDISFKFSGEITIGSA